MPAPIKLRRTRLVWSFIQFEFRYHRLRIGCSVAAIGLMTVAADVVLEKGLLSGPRPMPTMPRLWAADSPPVALSAQPVPLRPEPSQAKQAQPPTLPQVVHPAH